MRSSTRAALRLARLYKGILDGRARAVFNGRIFVHKGAQKTDAKQTNRNLLLSKEALVNTTRTRDLRRRRQVHPCSTSASSTPRRSSTCARAHRLEAAKSLLTYAFASDIVERIKLQPLREELEALSSRGCDGDVVRDAV